MKLTLLEKELLLAKKVKTNQLCRNIATEQQHFSSTHIRTFYDLRTCKLIILHPDENGVNVLDLRHHKNEVILYLYTVHHTCILKNPNECQTMLDQHHWNVGVDNLDYQYWLVNIKQYSSYSTIVATCSVTDRLDPHPFNKPSSVKAIFIFYSR